LHCFGKDEDVLVQMIQMFAALHWAVVALHPDHRLNEVEAAIDYVLGNLMRLKLIIK
jgi:hypothetical protein